MKVKRIFSSVMALGLVLTLAACSSNNKDNASNASTADGNQDAQSAKDFKKQTDDNTIAVGVESLGGDFIQGFNNNASDVLVRDFMGIQGQVSYNTYIQDSEGVWKWNPTVLEEEPKTVKNDDGTETTTYKIKKDLKWSDGEGVTADDYLFMSLLHSLNDYRIITGSTEIGFDTGKGYEAYANGDVDMFEGVKKIDDYTFECTVDSKFVPYFENQALKNAAVRPIHYIAKNLTVKDNKLVAKDDYKMTDDDKKAYIESINKQIETENSRFEEEKKASEGKVDENTQKKHDESIKVLEDKKAKAEKGEDIDPTKMLIEQAMIFDANNYRLKPEVTCGPYKFVSFENNMVKLALNENYAGDFHGNKPSIPNVIIQVVNPEIAVDLVKNGDIDIWEQETKASRIKQIKDGGGQIGGSVTFSRNGYGVLKFLTDRGATQHKEVRQAIAYLMDRNDFVKKFAGGHGVVTNGEYGRSQWMYKERSKELQKELTNYTLNVEKANEVLNNSPYKFEKDGKTVWDSAKAQEAYKADAEKFDYWRYNDKGEKLQVNQFGAKQSEITTLLSNILPDNAKQAGLEYNVQAGDFNTLLDYLYSPKEDAEYTAFNLGTNFGVPYDPYYQYNSEGNDNQTRTKDPKADELTVKLRTTDPSDKEGYLNTWLEFQKWYNDYLPEIPLYSNEYYNVYSNRIEGYVGREDAKDNDEGVSPFWNVACQSTQMSLKK